MNILGASNRFITFDPSKVVRLWLTALLTALVNWPGIALAYQAAQAPALTTSSMATPRPIYTQQVPEQLQQLVAPIALYPDSLVAQILAASTFPEQIVEAQRWLQAHPDMKSDALAHAIDQQPWDPSVKALTAIPSVLGNMDKNLSWTSSLGDAYYNQQQAVMDAVQTMRQRAQAAGTLKSTQQQTVQDENTSILIQPANPETVYVPAYDPWLVYGAPVNAWPGWYAYPGIWYDGSELDFGLGFGIGYYGGYGWGWGRWGFDWGHRYSTFNNSRYYSRSNTFYNRNSYYHAGGQRGVQANVANGGNGGRQGAGSRPGARFNSSSAQARSFAGNDSAARGYTDARSETGARAGAFAGYDHGGETRAYSSRGAASFGGGQATPGQRGGGFSGGGSEHGGGGFAGSGGHGAGISGGSGGHGGGGHR